MYKIGSTLNIRLSKKSGTTEDEIKWINDRKNLTAEIIEAIKFKRMLEERYSRDQIMEIIYSRKGYEGIDNRYIEEEHSTKEKIKTNEIKDKQLKKNEKPSGLNALSSIRRVK